MRIRLLALACVLLVAACGSDDGGAQAGATSSTATTVAATTTTEPTTTAKPTTTGVVKDHAMVEGCRLLNLKEPNVYLAMDFFFLSRNERIATAANEFADADNDGDQRKAFSALADLNIACHKAGLLG